MPARGRLNPWIENLIGSFGRDEGTNVGPLKAHVIGVGHMSDSQALGSEGPTGLLFLSDEQVQIPAVLTASAWENLQDHEDRECFSSLLNTTVGIQDYKLQFHMSSEQTKSRFYLLVGKLVTTAVGVRDNTPCCTSLPSVRTKICHTWRAMLEQEEDSQNVESAFNLSELLGEWQQDCLQTALEHVRTKLSSVDPHCSTSSMNSPALPDTCTSTSWSIDSVRYKGINSFTAPVQLLLIPDIGGQQNLQSKTVTENVRNSKSKQSPESTNLQAAFTETGQQSTSEDFEFEPVVLSASEMSSMSNPWDMCPPPSNTSSTKSSPETRPVPHTPIFTESITNLCPLDTHTQISALSKESQKEITAESSLFPPYQRPLGSTNASSKQPAEAPSNTSQVADPTCSSQGSPDGQPSRKCKRVAVDVSLILDEEEQVDSSLPSWLLDTQMGATSEQNTSQTQCPTVRQLTKVYPCVHADGKPFSYTYQVKGQELQHLSSFMVEQDLQQWAVRYLLRPTHTEHGSTGVTATGAAHSHIALCKNMAI